MQYGGDTDMNKGISCLMINTDKWTKPYEKAKDRLTTVGSKFIKVQKNNGQLREPSSKGKNCEKVCIGHAGYDVHHPGRCFGPGAG